MSSPVSVSSGSSAPTIHNADPNLIDDIPKGLREILVPHHLTLHRFERTVNGRVRLWFPFCEEVMRRIANDIQSHPESHLFSCARSSSGSMAYTEMFMAITFTPRSNPVKCVSLKSSTVIAPPRSSILMPRPVVSSVPPTLDGLDNAATACITGTDSLTFLHNGDQRTRLDEDDIDLDDIPQFLSQPPPVPDRLKLLPQPVLDAGDLEIVNKQLKKLEKADKKNNIEKANRLITQINKFYKSVSPVVSPVVAEPKMPPTPPAQPSTPKVNTPVPESEPDMPPTPEAPKSPEVVKAVKKRKRKPAAAEEAEVRVVKRKRSDTIEVVDEDVFMLSQPVPIDGTEFRKVISRRPKGFGRDMIQFMRGCGFKMSDGVGPGEAAALLKIFLSRYYPEDDPVVLATYALPVKIQGK